MQTYSPFDRATRVFRKSHLCNCVDVTGWPTVAYAEILSHDSLVPTDQDWAWFRSRVREVRMGPPEISQRQAAQRARISAKTWANVESGEAQAAPGLKVPPPPGEETVRLAIAQSLGLEDEVSQRLRDRRARPCAGPSG